MIGGPFDTDTQSLRKLSAVQILQRIGGLVFQLDN